MIYVLLFILLVFSFSIYINDFGTGEIVSKLLFNYGNHSFKPFPVISNTTVKKKLLFSESGSKGTLEKKEESELSCARIALNLKKCNQQLSRSLKTLAYVSIMEVRSEIKNNPDRLADILNLKASVQRDVIKITTQINYYKSLINK